MTPSGPSGGMKHCRPESGPVSGVPTWEDGVGVGLRKPSSCHVEKACLRMKASRAKDRDEKTVLKSLDPAVLLFPSHVSK